MRPGNRRPIFGLIGAGRVGTAFAYWLERAGYTVAGAWDSSPAALARAEKIMGRRVRVSLDRLVEASNILLVGTPDATIPRIARRIGGALRRDTTLFHFSGVLGPRLVKRTGVSQGVIHPLAAFPDYGAYRKMKDCYFSVSGDPRAVRTAQHFLRRMGMKYFVLGARDRRYYHLAAVFASNFLVALLAVAARLGLRSGIKEQDFIRYFQPLITGQLADVMRQGLKKSLSGPVERGELKTIVAHRRALRVAGRDYLKIYDLLSRELLRLCPGPGRRRAVLEKLFDED